MTIEQLGYWFGYGLAMSIGIIGIIIMVLVSELYGKPRFIAYLKRRHNQ